jgi:hypothetical protein
MMYLCLDLCPRPGTDMLTFDTVAEVLANPSVQTDAWLRNWQVFTDAEAAQRYADASPTIVVMPLVLQDGPVPGFAR